MTEKLKKKWIDNFRFEIFLWKIVLMINFTPSVSFAMIFQNMIFLKKNRFHFPGERVASIKTHWAIYLKVLSKLRTSLKVSMTGLVHHEQAHKVKYLAYCILLQNKLLVMLTPHILVIPVFQRLTAFTQLLSTQCISIMLILFCEN